MFEQTTAAYYANIFMAGNIEDAKRICAEFCFKVGLCVTVTKTEYIYTGGRESGFVVGLVNYPRFPADPGEIAATAKTLAAVLISGLHQHSALVQTPDAATWFTRRPVESSDYEAPKKEQVE